MTRFFCVVKEVDIQRNSLYFFQPSFLALVNLSFHVANQMLALLLHGKDDLPLSSISTGFILATTHSARNGSHSKKEIWSRVKCPLNTLCRMAQTWFEELSRHQFNILANILGTQHCQVPSVSKTGLTYPEKFSRIPVTISNYFLKSIQSRNQAYLTKILHKTAQLCGIGIFFQNVVSVLYQLAIMI